MKPTPVIRREQFLYALGAIQTLTPITREEMYLGNLCGQNNVLPYPVTRYEQYLYKMCGESIDVPTPVTRLEMFWYRACDIEYETPEPVTREEIYWDEYIKEYVTVKTLTGTLPLAFRTSETALRSWTIYGNNTPHSYSATGTLPLTFTTHTAGAASDWSISGNDNVEKNLLKLTGTTVVDNGVTFTIDPIAGTVTANGKATGGQGRCAFYINLSDTQNVYLSGCPEGGSSSTYNMYPWDSTTGARPKKWDGTTSQTESDYGTGALEVQAVAGHNVSCTIRIEQGYTAGNLVFKPMYRPADTSADFEPYQIGVGQMTANLFNINASTLVPINEREYRFGVSLGKLDAGGYVLSFVNSSAYTLYITKRSGTSYTQTSTISTSPFAFSVNDSVDEVYLRTTRRQEGTPSTWADMGFTDIIINAGSTAPSTFIPYGYEIPISVNGNAQTFYIGSTPLTAGQSISKTSTGVDIAAIAGENTITTDLYNKPSMAIEGVDYVGVGEYVNGQWQIPLTVTHYTDNIFDKDAKNTNKGYEDSTCIMWAGSIPYPYMTGNIPEDNNCFVSEKIPASPNTTYYLTDGIFKNTDNGIYSVFLWNRFRMSDYQAFPTEKTFTTGDDTKFIQLCVLKAYADTVMITTKPTETYIPHVEVNNVNVPIDAPLTEGQSVPDTLTINTFEGANTIDTTLTNKPQISITYKGG